MQLNWYGNRVVIFGDPIRHKPSDYTLNFGIAIMKDPLHQRGDDAEARAQDAVRELIRWAGEDPDREGLRDTPKRVAKAFLEYFRGYQEDPVVYLARTFEEVSGYDEVVLLRDIPFVSHCEHHLAPIIGKAHVAYLPNTKVSVFQNWRGSFMLMRGVCRCKSG
ncbi:hypothetical protein JCM17845_06940 [Iodidimonas gelatinilytica]|uniref:GTP cyclohydrolase I n=1 Tax=Iodidimonas gelatinilytica TaxID=1236966 RepID=A0A5A7MVN2_9PROT|nr:hypothetical protein JCM17845_06940 [Iodidimonas gelatinilytica]